jgi:putative copper export protein
VADAVAIVLRSLAFGAALQAAGMPIFIWLFGNSLGHSARAIRALAVPIVVSGLVLTILHAVIEPVRLTGDLRSIFDSSLQALLLASDSGTAIGVRVFGLAMILSGLLKSSRPGEAAALLGTSLIAASFAFMGHTATHDQRWLLAPLLIIHIAAIAFWFGGLWPLLVSTRHENAEIAGAIIEQFSRVAVWLVPIIFAAGLAMTTLLLPSLASLGTPYGKSLIAKTSGFTILMGLAAANRWRFGPKVKTGDTLSLSAFRRSVLAEWFLIVVVVTITAAMTALFSPEI